jgi:hypothetical protein
VDRTRQEQYGQPDYYVVWRLADGRYLGVLPLTFGRARIFLGPDMLSIDDSW